ncbi:hypothetical protein ACH5RR_037430 [Cinchona calisaya]|uniref:Uncharacterized protein n=1 Tax=Cinchona calisaya TaxID=153742 RepID=A0ABD2Y7J6_9GENT
MTGSLSVAKHANIFINDHQIRVLKSGSSPIQSIFTSYRASGRGSSLVISLSMITASGSRIAIPSLHPPAIPPCHAIFSAKTKHQVKEINQLNFIHPSGYERLQICTARQPFGDRRSIRHKMLSQSALSICLASLDARCVAIQALSSVERQSTITIPRIKGDIKAPRLSDNGPGLPPRGGGGRGQGGGGGGGAGGGGYWFLYGGFFLLLFLAFLAYLNDQEKTD